MEYKIGDRVICIPGFDVYDDDGDNNGGFGYEEGKVFIIGSIREDTGDNNFTAIWPDDGPYGVYQQAVRLYNPIKPYKDIKKHEMI